MKIKRLPAGGVVTYLYLEEVLRWAIYLFEALLARIWHSLHDCGGIARHLTACSKA